jgi:hypothetical protein
MKSKSLLDQYKEEFSESDDRFCEYCLVIESSDGCDCDQRAWRTFDELDEQSQLKVINQEIGHAFEKEMK